MTTLHADRDLARRYSTTVDRILAAHVRTVARLRPESRATVLPVADGIALYYGPGTPPGPNRVTGLGMYGPVNAAHLQAAEAFYAERNLPCVVSVFPSADDSLVNETGSRGYVVGTFRNILMRPVSAEDAGPPHRNTLPADSTTAEVAVERATEDEASLWARVVGSGFAEQELDTPPVARLATFHCPDTVCYFGRIGSVEAGGGAMTIRDGFAYIWELGTRPSFRRRGVQLAIYQTLVREAARAGCELAGLATEVGHVSQRNAERAGFRVMFTAAAVVRQLPGAATVRVH